MRRITILAALAVLLLAAGAGSAQNAVSLDAGTTQLSLTPSLSVHRDDSGRMTLDQARQGFRDGLFRPARKPWPSFGYTRSAIWARFAVRSESPTRTLWLVGLETARLDEVDWYLVRGNGSVQHLTAGNMRAHSPELVANRYPMFPLELSADENAEVFLRVGSEASVFLPLTLWNPLDFIAVQSRNTALTAGFFGYLAALILLSLILNLFTGARAYVIYSLSLLGLLGMALILSGNYTYLRLPAARFAAKAGHLLSIEVGLVLHLAFVRELFDFRAARPRLDLWIGRAVWANALFAVLLLLGPFRTALILMQLQVVLVSAGSTGLGLLALRQGNRAARFYVVGMLCLWLPTAASVLQSVGWIERSGLPELPYIPAVALSVTILFVAMADRAREVGRSVERERSHVLELEKQASRDLEAQTRQQRQLIRDLHDGIGGLTSNVGILAEMGRRQAGDENDRASFERISMIAAEGAAEIRSLMSSMESRDLGWLDLIVECRRHADLVLNSYGIEFDLSVSGECDQSGPGLFPGMSLFRVFKEAVTNIAKHSGASRAEARMEFAPDRFRMTIRDNGHGIDSARGSGRGLPNMEARVRELGGTMTLAADSGTELVFDLPLPLKTPPNMEHIGDWGTPPAA